jgi:hypothetical protein
MTPAARIDAAEDVVVSRGLGSPDMDLLRAAQVLHHATREAQACLRWASGQRIGAGGIAHADLSRILSAAGRGEDWKALLEKVRATRGQLPRG